MEASAIHAPASVGRLPLGLGLLRLRSDEQLLAYFRSWSATQRYIKDKGHDPVALVEPDLRAAWGDSQQRRDVRWQFHVRCGKPV